ncbi:MAG TPA: aldo/keto reductase, partial [Caulobacteraceae bacterium]|nr:aldo/keto reductase [Caulobacteraceae bacterium]
EEREMLPLCRDQGVGVIPWSPLARGFLAGGRSAPGEGNTERARTDEFSTRLYYKDTDNAVVDALSASARERGVSNMQLALAWVLKNPTITSPIIGTSKPHHLDDALAGLSLQLTDDEIKTLEAGYQPKPVLDHL